jgi:hypothetical protein
MINSINPNKILILKIKELILSTMNKYDIFLIKERKDNTYYDKIIK